MNIDFFKTYLRQNLTNERYEHSLGAYEAAGEICKFLGVENEKAEIASLIHDCAKCLPNDELLRLISQNNINVTKMELENFKTLHAPVGAYVAKTVFDIEDNEILDAIRFHTIGRINMSQTEKIVFLADKIEARTRRPDISELLWDALREHGNMDDAIILCYKATIKKLIDNNLVIHPQTVEVYDSLILEVKKSRLTL